MSTPLRAARPSYAWAVTLYDRVYRFGHGLSTPASEVGPALRLEIRHRRRAVRLGDGTVIDAGERIGVLHLNNDRVVTLHADGGPVAVGLGFRRQVLASLRVLAAFSQHGGPLADVRAFCATTIFHRGLKRLGFETAAEGLAWSVLVAAYQRSLLSSLHPRGALRSHRAAYIRAELLWMSREKLLAGYGSAVPGSSNDGRLDKPTAAPSAPRGTGGAAASRRTRPSRLARIPWR
jgi:hypothetical protein